MRVLPYVLALAFAGGPAGVAMAEVAQAEVIARIGSFELHRDLFEDLWASLPPNQQAAYALAGGQAAYLDDYIQQKLVALRAEELGYASRPELRASLENARNQILGRALVQTEVTAQVVTPKAMREYYQAHLDGFKIPEKVRIRHIVVTPHKERALKNTKNDDATTDATAKAKIERLKKELTAGADFAELARAWSEDTTAENGGELEEFARGKMARTIEDVAFALTVGQVSDIIQTPYGYHLVVLLARIPERQQSFEEVEDRLFMAVSQDRRAAFQPQLEQLTEQLRQQLPITIVDPALRRPASATGPTGAPAQSRPSR